MSSSQKDEPTLIDITRAETMLQMVLKDYAAMQKEADALAKELVSQQKGDAKTSSAKAVRLRTLVSSLRTADKDIEDQLRVLRKAAREDSANVAHAFAQTQENVSNLEAVLKKLHIDDVEEQTLRHRVETAEGAGATSLLETQSQYIRMLLTLAATLVVVGATALAVLKPEYMWLAQGIALLCLIVALYYLVRYLVRKFQ
jgi:hypothetical protein